MITRFFSSEQQKELWKKFYDRESEGELKWVGIPFPCHSYAQEANMDLFSYIDFVKKSLFLDKEDPAQEWINMKKKTTENY